MSLILLFVVIGIVVAILGPALVNAYECENFRELYGAENTHGLKGDSATAEERRTIWQPVVTKQIQKAVEDYSRTYNMYWALLHNSGETLSAEEANRRIERLNGYRGELTDKRAHIRELVETAEYFGFAIPEEASEMAELP